GVDNVGAFPMKAITVCVEYDDLLAITLPRMLAVFDDVLVVTDSHDKATQEIANRLGVYCLQTNAFYAQGASFNKGNALNAAVLHQAQPASWLAVIDADIVLPERADLTGLQPGTLYGATRRIVNPIWLPHDWSKFPTYPDRYPWNGAEVTLGGHFLVFHTGDPVIETWPWFPDDWKHAGGYDSDFIAQWPPEKQVRLPFEVLHLGPLAMNWHGRITPRLDGKPIPEQEAREALRAAMWRERRRSGYTKERL
ncbi:MAG: hypothetical protein ACE5GE_16745, partial [Phycisphaerae bacterium]